MFFKPLTRKLALILDSLSVLWYSQSSVLWYSQSSATQEQEIQGSLHGSYNVYHSALVPHELLGLMMTA